METSSDPAGCGPRKPQFASLAAAIAIASIHCLRQQEEEEEEMGVAMVGELKHSFSAKRGVRQNLGASLGGEWPPSDTSSDLLVEVGPATFSLHKLPLLSRSGKIRKLLQQSEAAAPPQQITLPAFPGGAATFELAAKFCYGINFIIDSDNIATLLCAANYLQMTEDISAGNLVSLAETYLRQSILPNVSLSAAVLRRCDSLLSAAAEINLIDTLISHLASTISDEEAHLAAISTLNPNFFRQIILTMKTKTLNQETPCKIIIHYVQSLLSGKDRVSLSTVETVVSLLPTTNSLTTTFLSGLLKAAGGASCREKIEKMMAMKLEQAVLEDILIPASSSSRHHHQIYDTDVVFRIFSEFLSLQEDLGFEGREESSLRKIAKLMDGYLAEIALDSNLPPSKFISLAELLPDHARLHSDGLYRAVDLFLKVHPNTKEAERYRLCRAMDCEKLTEEACGHAAQNERLPVHVAVQVLYLEQRRLRSELSRGGGGGGGAGGGSGVGSPRDSYALVRRENRELRMEVARMRTRLSELEKDHVSMKKELVRANPASGILRSFSKTLEKLQGFLRTRERKKGGPLTPAGPVDPRPFFLRRRRHSVS